MRITFRRKPRETGLRSIGTGPRGFHMTRGGEVVGSVDASGGDWRGPLKGWYYVIYSGAAYPGSPLINAHMHLHPEADDAKAEALAEFKRLEATKEPTK